MRRLKALTALLALTLLVCGLSVRAVSAPDTAPASQPASAPADAWGLAVDGLQLQLQAPKSRYRLGEPIDFKLTIRNGGPQNHLLNGGLLLGNGQQAWNAFAWTLVDGKGRVIPFDVPWGVWFVSGRVYFLGLPLPAGGSHSWSISSRNYLIDHGQGLAITGIWMQDTLFPAGTYQLTCTYTGSQSELRDATQMPKCWEGKLISNTLRFTVER
jgi:hypothetical protein